MKRVQGNVSRRDVLALSGLAVGALAARGGISATPLVAPPTAPVAVAKVSGYDQDLVAQFERMFDQLGGIGHLVRGKTIGMKLNMTGARAGAAGSASAPARPPGCIRMLSAHSPRSWASWVRSGSGCSRAHSGKKAGCSKTPCCRMAGMSTPSETRLRVSSSRTPTDWAWPRSTRSRGQVPAVHLPGLCPQSFL